MLNPKGVVVDVKSIYEKKDFAKMKINYWSL